LELKQVDTPTPTPTPSATATPTPSASPTIEATATPAATPTMSVVKKKLITIQCIKGKTVKKVTAVAPKCPAGFKKKG